SPLLNNPKAYSAFINEYFSSANAKRSRAAVFNLVKEQISDIEEQIDAAKVYLESEHSEEILETIENLEEEKENLLKEERFESELRDPSDKLTGLVKQRLISVKYNDKGRTIYAPLHKAHSALISLTYQVDNSSFELLIKSLRQRLSLYFKEGETSTTKLFSNVRKATAAYLLEIIDSIDNNTSPKHLSFRKDINFKSDYLILSKDKTDVTNISFTEATSNPSRYLIVEKFEDETPSIFSARVINSNLATLSELKKAYKLYEDINFLRTVVATTASLRKSKPVIGSSKWEFYNFKNKYTITASSGQRAAVESRFVESFVNYFIKKGTPLDFQTISTLNKAVTPEQKASALNLFLRKIKLPLISRLIPDQQIVEAFETLKISTPQINDQLGYGNNPYEVLSDQGTLISKIVELLENSASMIENHSYIRGDGKKAYLYQDASYQSSLLSFIELHLKGLLSKAPRHLSFNNKKLSTKTKIYSLNPFVNSKNNIYSFVDHDSLKRLGNDPKATYLYSEKINDFHKRNFVFGFLNRLKSSQSSKYYQFLPVPSNRR
ncbi:MAG: hypothetical protein ACRDBG_18715, partial [Waterburya sp.]